jgi:hypothetical protein
MSPRSKGYFKARGLDVRVVAHGSSPESIRELKKGKVDLACCGAFNLMTDVLAGDSDLRCAWRSPEGSLRIRLSLIEPVERIDRYDE